MQRNSEKHRERRIDFAKLRPIGLALSLVLVLLSLTFMAARGLNWGPDFRGGTLLHVRFAAPVAEGELRGAVAGAQVQPVLGSAGREVLVHGNAGADGSMSVLKAGLARVGSFQCLRQEVVGPSMGRILQGRAAAALVVALCLIIGYLALRFRPGDAAAAALALIHDCTVVVGMLALVGARIDLGVVAALLAILGYSLNDSIVVLDRIRENMRLEKGKRPFSRLVDRSLEQSLARTVTTSLTTLLPVLFLIGLAGPTLRGFSIALGVGVVVGTWSSLFVVSAVAVAMQAKERVREPKRV